MSNTNALNPFLKKTARSFYLSIRILPEGIRIPIAIAYLLARFADTAADAPGLEVDTKKARLKLIKEQIVSFNPAHPDWKKYPAEGVASAKNLSESLTHFHSLKSPVKESVARIVCELIDGMEQNICDFPGNSPKDIRALKTKADLDRYCHQAAGIVGPFWSKVIAMKHDELHPLTEGINHARSVAFGKGLQLINVLKDIPQDYLAGRAYLPLDDLQKASVSLLDLGNPHYDSNIRPLANQLIDKSLACLKEGNAYVLSIPKKFYRLRLATLWPLWFGLATLEKIAHHDNMLAIDKPVKIKRRRIYALMLKSLVFALSNHLIHYHFLENSEKIRK